MTYEQWERVKDECHNAKMVAFCGMSKEAQEAMVVARSAGICVEIFTLDGDWREYNNREAFFPGAVLRVSHSWPGPAKSEPAVEYEDVPMFARGDRFVFGRDDCFLSIAFAYTSARFAGYVMPDGRIRSRLIFDKQKDGTYRLIVPKAVRMVKEASK